MTTTPIMADVIFSSVTRLAAAIRAGQISAAEVLEAHLAQIAIHNPALNAVTTIDAGKAQERARAADAALARDEIWGPLHGVPFTLKDAHSTAGMPTTVGFPPLAGHVPTEDSTVTARLKQAGGVLIGKTNVPAMLGDFQTDNPVFGRTNNPWNLERTPGGSSGGAAAALASGMTPFEIGTDLASSIRLPAHFCGLFGLKPTERRVSLAGLIPNPQGTPRSVRAMSCDPHGRRFSPTFWGNRRTGRTRYRSAACAGRQCANTLAQSAADRVCPNVPRISSRRGCS